MPKKQAHTRLQPTLPPLPNSNLDSHAIKIFGFHDIHDGNMLLARPSKMVQGVRTWVPSLATMTGNSTLIGQGQVVGRQQDKVPDPEDNRIAGKEATTELAA